MDNKIYKWTIVHLFGHLFKKMDTKEKILEIFIKNPEKEFHVRQTAKIVKKSPSTISKYLKQLEKEGILFSEKKFNHLFFKASLDNKRYKNLKINYNLRILERSGLIDFLVEKFDYPEAIVLFGSFAKGENNYRSDVDLLIISALKKQPDLSKYENKLNHKIQLFIHSNKEIKEIKKKNKEILNSWINGIIIYGNLEVFK